MFHSVPQPKQPSARNRAGCLVALALMACIVWLGGSAGPAEAAAVSELLQPANLSDQQAALQPILIAKKGKKKRKRRAKKKRKKKNSDNAGGKKPASNIQNTPKNQNIQNTPKNLNTQNTPKNQNTQNTPKNQGTPDKPNTSGNTTAQNKPNNRRPTNIVCIGGRAKGGRCRCRAAAKQHQIRPSVFSCARGGATVSLPAGGPRPATSPAVAASQQATPAAAALPTFAPNEVLITVSGTTPESGDAAVAARYNIELFQRVPIALLNIRMVRYRIPDGRTVATVIAALQADPDITAPQPNYYYRHQAGTADTDTNDLQYALAKVDVISAHRLARGRGARVSIIDSGIDDTHPELAEAVAGRFNAISRSDLAPDAHGTAVAGIIRSRGTVQGVAPEAQLLSVQVFAPVGASQTPAATTFNVLRGIDWSIANRARIINMSFAGPSDPLLRRGIEAAYKRNAIIVAAAGNNGPDAPAVYPAAYEQVIAVTATDIDDRLYISANHGQYIAVAAPGVDILTPALEHAHQLQTGTSFAAAHISGIIALMLERNPKLSADAVLSALSSTATDLGAPGHDTLFGAGRADAYKSTQLVSKR